MNTERAPKKIKKRIIRIYWTCGIEEHSHQTKQTAERCIEKQQRPKPRRWSNEGLLELLKKFRSGMRQVDVAKEACVSRQHLRQLLKKAERIERQRSLPKTKDEVAFETLTMRVRHILYAAGITTVRGAREALESGQLDGNYGFGVEARSEIHKWLRRYWHVVERGEQFYEGGAP